MSLAADKALAPGLPRLSDAEFALLRALIHREAGIDLGDSKKALLVARLSKRVRALGVRSFGEYCKRAQADPGGELVRLLDCVCTNETEFFREPRHFELLEREILPVWRQRALAGQRPRHVRAWSAACSTGEEPFSLAMTLLDGLPGWSVEVLATDLSTRVLEQASEAIWPAARARSIPERLLHAYMLRGVGSQEGRVRAGPALRPLVRFQRFNLARADWPDLGRFDLVFCRNVLIYFDAATKARVVDLLVERLTQDGLLFLGHAETALGARARARAIAPTVYALREAAGAGRGAA